jgi:O-antigen ligase
MVLLLTPVVAYVSPRFLAFWPGIAGLVLFTLARLMTGRWPRIPHELLLWCGGIVSLAAVSALWAIDQEVSTERAVKLAVILGPSLLLIAALSHLNTIKFEVPSQLLFGFCGLVFVLVAALGVEIKFDYVVYRLLNGLGALDPVSSSRLNRSVIALTGLIFIAIGLLYGMKQKLLAAVLPLCCLPLVLWGDSQSMLVGLVLAMLVYYLFPYRSNIVWRGSMVLLFVMILIAPYLASYLFVNFADTVNSFPIIGGNQGYGGERLEIWDAVSRFALQNAFYGFGIEATRSVEAFDTAQIYRQSVTELHPHNFAVQLWIEFGVIGALLGGAFLTRVLIVVKALPFAAARIALASTVFLLVIAAFSYGLWQSWFVGLIVLVYGFNLYMIAFLKQRQQPSVQKESGDQTQKAAAI